MSAVRDELLERFPNVESVVAGTLTKTREEFMDAGVHPFVRNPFEKLCLRDTILGGISMYVRLLCDNLHMVSMSRRCVSVALSLQLSYR